MQTIYFVTSSDDKFTEAKAILPQLERIEADLPEEQALDPHFVVSQKLTAARSCYKRPLIIEDTSLYLDGLNGFPGPLIKWMLKAVGNEGIYELCQSIKNRRAAAKTVIGYEDGSGTIKYFEGSVNGHIVAPSGNEGFGRDAIFQPDGLSETYAEMGDEFKPEFSMRTRAFNKLKEYLVDK